jgi:hypothetical protein
MSLKSKHTISILFCVFVFVILSGCTSGSSSNNAPTATPSSAPTAVPSAVTTVEPIAIPGPVTEPAPINLVGSGQQTSQQFRLENGLSLFSMQHHGSSNFLIWLVDSSGKKVDLLVDVIGEFGGSKAEGITAADDYRLDITADGQWSVDITQPRPQVAAPAPLGMTGVGQHATRFFSLKQGVATFRMTHNGTSNFAVWLDDVNGKHVDLLANVSGTFNGTKAEDIDQTGIYLLDIDADGEWKIDISK